MEDSQAMTQRERIEYARDTGHQTQGTLKYATDLSGPESNDF